MAVTKRDGKVVLNFQFKGENSLKPSWWKGRLGRSSGNSHLAKEFIIISTTYFQAAKFPCWIGP
jgi:hypothetical protein